MTKRLALIPVNSSHIADIFKYFTYEVTEYMYPKPPERIEETENVVNNFIINNKKDIEYVYAITLHQTDEFLGLAGLHNLKGTPELGIWTKSDVHGNHYGREAIGGLIDKAKSMGYKCLIYPVDQRNIASKKIPEYYGGKIIEEMKVVQSMSNRTLEILTYQIDI